MNHKEAADPADTVDHNHSHTQIVNRVPQYSQVLELGCSTGEMSRMLKQVCQAQVFGVEKDPQSAWQAQRHCDYVFTEDLDEADSLDALQFEKFDVITLVDVLEHLCHPEELLERLKPLLLEEGTILLSVPNVAHASVRLELLTGDFRYEEAGILDSTHLKFFTLKSLQSMLTRCGFVINDIDYTWHDMPDSVITRYLRQVGIEVTPRILDYFHQPEAVAYQFIISISLPKQSAEPDYPGDDADYKSTVIPPLEHNLKPMAASWQTWGQVFGNLQQKEQVIRGLELKIQSCEDELSGLHQDVQLKSEELERVYATRSWRMLRRVAGLWRRQGDEVQGRLTHP